MTKPSRIQLSRKKGWRKPDNCVVVARPTRWGNPYKVGAQDPFRGIGHYIDQERAVELYRWGVENGFVTVPHTVLEAHERQDGMTSWGAHHVVEVAAKYLRGKDLACWCPLDQPCHADVLLEIANAGETPK